ncbi:hypothetical protein L1887_50833 [Cichorium endivia]|nr:hypothetical protein L1887_50833 [Cichorium endivia]
MHCVGTAWAAALGLRENMPMLACSALPAHPTDASGQRLACTASCRALAQTPPHIPYLRVAESPSPPPIPLWIGPQPSKWFLAVLEPASRSRSPLRPILSWSAKSGSESNRFQPDRAKKGKDECACGPSVGLA